MASSDAFPERAPRVHPEAATPPVAPPGAPILEVRGITKHFGGILALDHVSLSVAPAEMVGLVGPNGAGKTTLFECVVGAVSPDAGTVLFQGTPLDRLPPSARSRLGIGRTFQRIELFAGMTPRDHLLVAVRVRKGTGRLWKDVVGLGRPTSDERREAELLLAQVGLTAVADRPVETLSLGQGRLVEIARALAGHPRLLMLDEPSSGLAGAERRDLVALVRRLNEDRATAMVLIDHDLEVVATATTRLVVLDSGRVLADGPTPDVLAGGELRRAYVGSGP